MAIGAADRRFLSIVGDVPKAKLAKLAGAHSIVPSVVFDFDKIDRHDARPQTQRLFDRMTNQIVRERLTVRHHQSAVEHVLEAVSERDVRADPARLQPFAALLHEAGRAAFVVRIMDRIIECVAAGRSMIVQIEAEPSTGLARGRAFADDERGHRAEQDQAQSESKQTNHEVNSQMPHD